MTVENIIKAVRYCIDEEASNDGNLSDASQNDNTYMDNIIKDKIGDALRWVCLYAPADLLGGSDETETSGGTTTEISTGIMVDMTATPTAISGQTGGTVALPQDFIKLARVRVDGWHRAVKTPISEDSDEYLQLYDGYGATATLDRPQAALIEKTTRELEVWPIAMTSDTPPAPVTNCCKYTYVAAVKDSDMIKVPEGEAATDANTKVALPPRVKSSFIYYLAFLLCSAYGDARGARMLEIAKMNMERG